MPTQFISKAHNLQVTLETQQPVMVAGGNQTFTKGKRVQFSRGLLTADTRTAKDVGYQTADELANALRKAGSFNSEFWEVGNEPGAVKPSAEEMLGWIADAAVDGNQKRLRELLAQETETHNRELIVSAAQRALGRLGDVEAGKRGPGRPPQRKQEPQEA